MGKNIVLASGLRTPFGQINKALAKYSSVEMAALVMKTLMEKSGLPKEKVDGVILGEVSQTSKAPNSARVAALKAGLPIGCVAHTVQNNCISGIQAITDAARKIICGEGEVFIAAGVESMSNMLVYVKNARQKYGGNLKAIKNAIADAEFVDCIVEGLTDPISGMNMAESAEMTAQNLEISRDSQDAYALGSFQKSYRAEQEGFYDDVLIPLPELVRDESPYLRETLAADSEKSRKLMKKSPLIIRAMGMSVEDFWKKNNAYMPRDYDPVFEGTVTLFNSCPQSDGAAAVIVASEEAAKRLGLAIHMYLRGWGFAGLHPAYMGITPAQAVPKALTHADLSFDNVDFFEIHEPFAATVLGIFQSGYQNFEMDWKKKYDEGRVNRNGGSLSLGHPLGATGIRLALNAMSEFKKDANSSLAVAAACAGGGIGGAMVFERYR